MLLAVTPRQKKITNSICIQLKNLDYKCFVRMKGYARLSGLMLYSKALVISSI